MSEILMLLGFVWALFAPLLLVAAIVVVARTLRRRISGRAALGVALAVVLLPVAAVWSYQHAEFDALCANHRAAGTIEKAKADGFLLISETSNSFGIGYLQTQGFKWIEARDIYKRDGWVRYERDNIGAITTIPIENPTARYEVREVHSAPLSHTHLATTSVHDRESGRQLAQASSGHFSGGTMKWVLGAWGTGKCPNPMWDSEGFRRYYYLARDTLG